MDSDDSISSIIFQANIPFQDADEESICKDMVTSLSESQIEKAARTSHAYYVAMTCTNPDIPKPSSGVRERMAIRMARRHLVAEDGNKQNALKKMINTLEFRGQHQIDEMREPYDSSKNDESGHISTHPMADATAVNGYDIHGHAVSVRLSKKYVSQSDEAFFRLILSGIERSIACTERRSLGKEEKLIVAYDYTTSCSGAIPTFNACKMIISAFANHYPERLYMLICVEPSFSVNLLRNLCWPFVDSVTKSKVKFVKGEAQKEKEFKDLFDLEDSMPFLRKGGKVDPWNSEDYYRNIPFDHAAYEKI